MSYNNDDYYEPCLVYGVKEPSEDDIMLGSLPTGMRRFAQKLSTMAHGVIYGFRVDLNATIPSKMTSAFQQLELGEPCLYFAIDGADKLLQADYREY